MQTTYRAGPTGDYVVRPADDLTLVYHRPSGTTHVVAPVVVSILEVLHERALSAAEVTAALLERHAFDEECDVVAATVAARLAEIAAIDLIDRVG
jgi:PqqD family protein of HPr-rel-A system